MGPIPKSRSGRLNRTRHDHGHCQRCNAPLTRLPTGVFPWDCTACRLKHQPIHRRVNEARLDLCKANGTCVSCTHPVTQINPQTGEPYRRCLPCRKHLRQARMEATHVRQPRRALA